MATLTEAFESFQHTVWRLEGRDTYVAIHAVPLRELHLADAKFDGNGQAILARAADRHRGNG